jgi:hypothetical protein
MNRQRLAALILLMAALCMTPVVATADVGEINSMIRAYPRGSPTSSRT